VNIWHDADFAVRERFLVADQFDLFRRLFLQVGSEAEGGIALAGYLNHFIALLYFLALHGYIMRVWTLYERRRAGKPAVAPSDPYYTWIQGGREENFGILNKFKKLTVPVKNLLTNMTVPSIIYYNGTVIS
jgi:hypothetical protein